MAKKILKDELEELSISFLKSFVERIIRHKNRRIEIEKEEKFHISPLVPRFERPLKKMPFPAPTFSQIYSSPGRIEYLPGRNTAPPKTQILQPRVIEHPLQQIINENPIDKIANIFRNPAVSIIECTGPGRNIVVTERGLIKVYPISLSKDEINEILEHFSEETNIPLIQGVFKAAYQNLFITAVISEIVGTRFVLQKRAQQLPQRYRW